MLYSASGRFLFSQAPRSASTSTSRVLQPFCCPAGTQVPQGVMDQMISDEGIIGAQGPSRFSARYYVHMPAEALRQALPDGVWQNAVHIANMRNPYTRILSNFSRLIRTRKIIVPTGSGQLEKVFEAWLTSRSPDEGYRAIFWIGSDFVVDEVVAFEALDDQIAGLCDRLGLPRQPCAPVLQKSHDQLAGTSVDRFFPPAVRAIVLKTAGWVFDRFGYSTDPRDAALLPAFADNARYPAKAADG